MLRALLKPSMVKRPDFITLDVEKLAAQGQALHAAYKVAEPFPHVVIDNFLPEQIANDILNAFPDKNAPMWFDWRQRDTVHQPKKLGIGHAERLVNAPPYIQHVLQVLNSYPILKFLQELTGISGLIPDPYFHGGGLHQILSGGKLAVHADFNFESFLQLYRRLNLLLYFNKDWEESYNGNL